MKELSILKLNRLTPTSVELTFSYKDWEEFSYKPGQYVDVDVEVADKTHRRAYSICHIDEESQQFSFAVKKVPEGLVSHFINDKLKEGDTLRLSKPLGRFLFEGEIDGAGKYLFIGAGSGVTPLIAMIESFLKAEKSSEGTLVLGNRNEEEVMFFQRLEELERAYPERFQVVHTLSRPGANWLGRRGRIGVENLKAVVKSLSYPASDLSGLYLCGPSKMMAVAKMVVEELGLPTEKVHQELFVDDKAGEEKGDEVKGACQATVVIDGKSHDIVLDKSENLLEAATPFHPPFSCRFGQCGVCRVKVIEGKVREEYNEVLTDKEKEAGFVLACQAYAESDKVVYDFDLGAEDEDDDF
jgi:ring-1,2-phenylacetyl-CoA epoxidase subunit PaaE